MQWAHHHGDGVFHQGSLGFLSGCVLPKYSSLWCWSKWLFWRRSDGSESPSGKPTAWIWRAVVRLVPERDRDVCAWEFSIDKAYLSLQRKVTVQKRGHWLRSKKALTCNKPNQTGTCRNCIRWPACTPLSYLIRRQAQVIMVRYSIIRIGLISISLRPSISPKQSKIHFGNSVLQERVPRLPRWLLVLDTVKR